MCWLSDKKELTVAKVAGRNIPIFKICYIGSEGRISSVYLNMPYELKKRYTRLPLKVVENAVYGFRYSINEGFHSYSPKTTVRREKDRNFHYLIINSRNGEFLDAFNRGEVVRVNGYIPKGAEYVFNEFGEYVSTEIVLTEIENII